jgi:hypothetical protein
MMLPLSSLTSLSLSLSLLLSFSLSFGYAYQFFLIIPGTSGFDYNKAKRVSSVADIVF